MSSGSCSSVVTLNQPGNVAAALLADGRVIKGMTRDEGVRLIAPSYRPAPLPTRVAARLWPERSIIPYLAADVPTVIDRLSAINADPLQTLHGLLDLQRSESWASPSAQSWPRRRVRPYDRVNACLMLDAPVPSAVADAGLRKPALWLNRPTADQRAERAASGGWSEQGIAAQARSIARVVANSREVRVVNLRGLFTLILQMCRRSSL